MSRFQLLRTAREKVVAIKLEHQHRQVRKGARLPVTVSLERRAA